jgi:Flp pilus assembly protein TadG
MGYLAYCFSARLWRRLRRDERGNIFILFAASAIPLLLFMGGAVDMARFARYKADLSNSVDSAALALARQHDDYSKAEATTFAENYVRSFVTGNSQFSVDNVDVEKLPNGFRVTASGSMKTMFLPIAKLAKLGKSLDVLTVNVLAEVLNSTSRVELALVFDNTGSMNCGNFETPGCAGNWTNPGPGSRIVALRAAAHTLVDELMTTTNPQDPDVVKIGLVPFEGDVNVGPTIVDAAYAGHPPAWLDWSNQANAKYNGQNFGKYDFVANAPCTTGSNCKFVGHKWLFDKLTAKDPNVKWAGCVEMRAEPNDLLDTVPTAGTPNTLFVPRFWPDEPDSSNDDGDNYQNNYLNDKVSGLGAPATQKSLTKYTSATLAWQSGMKDTAFPYEHGPNWGCPRPIVPLTSDKPTIETAIDSMIAYYSTGTFIPTGLVWGWHVVSPTAPFTEGVETGDPNFHKTLKAVVLFTDGANVVSGTNNHNRSRFSGYNYTGLSVGGTYRLGSPNASVAVDNMDNKTAELCEHVKDNATPDEEDDNIRLYTVTFGSMSPADEALMRNCASLNQAGQPLYFHAPTTVDLQAIFDAIGHDLSNIHLSM